MYKDPDNTVKISSDNESSFGSVADIHSQRNNNKFSTTTNNNYNNARIALLPTFVLPV